MAVETVRFQPDQPEQLKSDCYGPVICKLPKISLSEFYNSKYFLHNSYDTKLEVHMHKLNNDLGVFLVE